MKFCIRLKKKNIYNKIIARSNASILKRTEIIIDYLLKNKNRFVWTFIN